MILTTRTRAPRQHSVPKTSAYTTGFKTRSFHQKQPKTPPPPTTPPGQPRGFRKQQQILPSRQAAVQECFNQEGSPRSLQGTPTPKSASTLEPGLQQPGGKLAICTKRPCLTLHSADTHPRLRGGSPGRKTLHSTRFAPGERTWRGWGPRPGRRGGRTAAPASAQRNERFARRKESPRFAHGVLPKPDSPPPPRPSKKREQ